MTDETTDAPEGDDAPAAEAAVVPASTAAVASAAEPVPFWRRPAFERFIAPLFIPIIAVLGIVIFVLNLSRLFLSAHGHIPVVVGSIITGVILFGAAIISNSSRLRSSSTNLLTVGFVLLVISGGWLVLGHSQVKNANGGTLAPTGPCSGNIDITALPSLKFTPSSLSMKTGVYCVTLTDAASAPHTLDFDDPNTLFPGLQVSAAGEKATGRIFFGSADAYTYFCAIPGHRAAGMQGTVNVTGPTMTLEQAEAAAGSSGGGASGASGASGATGSTGSTGSTGASGATG
jgi:plastocyanin